MPADKRKKIEELSKRFSPEVREPLKEFLADKQVIDKKEFARLTGLLVDAFDETLAETPNEKRMDRKLRELIMGLFAVDYEGNIEDEVLQRATRIIREKIVRKNERDKLSRLLSKEVIKNWLSMDEDLIDHIAGFDGLLESLQDKAEGDLDYSDDELLDIMLEVGQILTANYMERLNDDELDNLLDRSIEVCEMIEKGEKPGDLLLALIQDVMKQMGFVALMRRALAGLLLSDLIVRQIGKSLGIKEKISVTDFIIFIGVKVFETENLKQADKEQIADVKKDFKRIRAL